MTPLLSVYLISRKDTRQPDCETEPGKVCYTNRPGCPLTVLVLEVSSNVNRHAAVGTPGDAVLDPKLQLLRRDVNLDYWKLTALSASQFTPRIAFRGRGNIPNQVLQTSFRDGGGRPRGQFTTTNSDLMTTTSNSKTR